MPNITKGDQAQKIVEGSIETIREKIGPQRGVAAMMVDKSQFVFFSVPEWMFKLGGQVNLADWSKPTLIDTGATLWQAKLSTKEVDNADENLNKEGGAETPPVTNTRKRRKEAGGGISRVHAFIYKPVKLTLDPAKVVMTRGAGGAKYKTKTLRFPQMASTRAIQFFLSQSPLLMHFWEHNYSFCFFELHQECLKFVSLRLQNLAMQIDFVAQTNKAESLNIDYWYCETTTSELLNLPF